MAAWPHACLAVISSSLGGFYATAVAERYGCKAVLLNPAVEPARDLGAYIDEQSAWHNADERFFSSSPVFSTSYVSCRRGR